MKNSLLLVSAILLSFISIGQNSPTLLSYEIDTLCEGEFDKNVINIQVQDLDADSTWITIDFVPGIYSQVIADPAPALVGGQQIRTFSISGQTSTVGPGLNLADINITLHSSFTGESSTPAVISNSAVYGYVSVSFNMSGAGLCENDQPVDLNQFASPLGGEFIWGDEEHEGNMFDPVLYLEDPSNVTYIYTNPAGCDYSAFDTPIFNVPAVLNISPINSTCGNADGSATVVISGGTGPYDLYWSTGKTVIGANSTELLSNIPSGTYYANVVNTYGCKTTISARISDNDILVTPSITDATCFENADGSIDLAVSATGNVTEIFWSNGSTTEDVSGLAAGEYAVEIHTDNNCNFYQEYVVTSPPRIDVDLSSTTPADCSDLITYGNSSINITTNGGVGPYLWDWNDGSYNTENLNSIPSGPYKCKVTDNNGCSLTWWMNLNDSNGPLITLKKIKKTKCGLDEGLIDISIYDGASAVISTLWSNGYTTEDMVDAPAGVFTVNVEDAGGCVTKNRYVIPAYRPATPQICLLTVDTTMIYNTVIWEKNMTQSDLAGFNIYRETTSVGEYEKVAYRPYSLESFFQDNAASPIDRSWRYYITAVDTCGNESFPSFLHKTIHCVIIDNLPNKDIYWDQYEGITYSSVDVHRYDDTNGWVTVAPNYTGNPPYTDAPPVLSGLDYLVTFNLASTCTSSKAQDYNSSRSNKSSSNYSPGGSTLEIENEDLGQISIYPNPTNGVVNIFVESPEMFEQIEIRNAEGKIIEQRILVNSLTYVDLNGLSNGIYFVRLISSDQIINHKIIKE